jgi:hypothetical protein
VSIVEGDGERSAVPILIRRIAQDLGIFDVHGYTTVLTQRNRFPRFPSERERAVRLARSELSDDGAILILLDSDGEPPCRDPRHRRSPCILGEQLLEAVAPLAAGLPIAVVMAEREYESWLVASAPTLIGMDGLRQDVQAPDDPDRLRNPKGWLSSNMSDRDRGYDPVADQARLTDRFDMALARERSPSFDHAYREIERLIRAVSHG